MPAWEDMLEGLEVVQEGATGVCAALFVLQASWLLLEGHFEGPFIALFPAVLVVLKWEL